MQPIDGEAFRALVEGSSPPFLLAFTASWCAPCSWLYPYLEALEKVPGAPPVYSIDIDTSPEVAEAFRIGSVPTTVLLVDGVERERSVGIEPDRLTAMSEPHRYGARERVEDREFGSP